MQKNNMSSMTPKNIQSKPQFPTEKYNQIYDEEFVSLINSLNESIKEYYKVSKNNITEANTILITYDQQAQSIINLMNLIANTSSSYDKLNELFAQIPRVLEVIKQMKINTNSNNNNLTLFFDDAKILFKSMKFKRKEKLNEINSNNINNQLIQTSSDSYNNSLNQDDKFTKNIGNKINEQINPNAGLNNSLANTINMVYTRIMKLLNGFSDYNYILSKINFEESNKFNNLQNSIKKEFENFFNFLRKNLRNNSNFMTQNKSCKNINENQLNQGRINNQGNVNNQEFEKLKKFNEMSKKKIMELNNQLNSCKNKIRDLEMKNNNFIIKLQNAEQTIMNLESNMNNNNMINNNTDFNNALNQKDFQIINLQKQLKVFQKNENALNIQINNLNNQFKEKLGQYEFKISQISESMTNQKKFIANLQNELSMKNNEIENMKLSMPDQPGYDVNKNIKILNMEIKEKESKIKALNEELINYQRKEKLNQKQIEDMNNNIFNYEKIIKQKDELINTNYKDNNDVLKIKLENEKLKKQVEELKNINNNYLLQNQRMINGNINSYEMPEMRNQEYIAKINELNQEIQNLKQNLSAINESKVKLELDIDKKNDELEGFKQVIFKLQNKLEKNEDDEEDRKRRTNTERSEHNNNNFKTEVNLRDQNASGKNLNKSFEMPKDSNTQLMNKFLGQLNEAEKKISLLQNKNRELQFKLDEKQVEKDFSGYRTEDYNFSNYEEEFDLKKMVNGAREKNRSEDINIDYPGVQSVKDKYKELLQNMHLLEEQVKILISNISCTNKTKPQITQICQLMRIPAKNIQAIIAGKDKKRMLGLVS
mgnify:CR=1 FL=1